MRIAYSGIEGSFAHTASLGIFPTGELIPCANFADAYKATVSGLCHAAVLPLENSFAGEVGKVTDLIFEGDLFVSAVYRLRVSQNLLGIPGSSADGIKTVISHPQALDQCATYIEEHRIATQGATNTARAALRVAKTGDPTVGAIASKTTARLYDLDILAPDINDDKMNTTRFAVLTRKRKPYLGDSTCILMFTVRNEAGALAKVLGVIGGHGFNMRVIRSRPLKGFRWRYYFYAEVEGNLFSGAGEAMVEDMKPFCESLKIGGSYDSSEQIIEE